MIRLRAEAPSTSHSLALPPLLPIPAPTSSSLLLLPSTNCREDRPEVTLPPRKRLGIALGPRYKVGESLYAAARPTGGLRVDYGFVATMDREIMRDLERDVGYKITNTWDEILEDMPTTPATDDTELDDEQTERQLMAGRLNMLYRDRRAHARTARLMEEMITELRTADHKRHAAITEMLAVDRRRHAQFIEALKLLKRLQTQMTEFERQQGPAKGPAQPDTLEEAGSSS
ncbi:hypothetical protein Tco_0299488 [Tanacetum coccineum]